MVPSCTCPSPNILHRIGAHVYYRNHTAVMFLHLCPLPIQSRISAGVPVQGLPYFGHVSISVFTGWQQNPCQHNTPTALQYWQKKIGTASPSLPPSLSKEWQEPQEWACSEDVGPRSSQSPPGPAGRTRALPPRLESSSRTHVRHPDSSGSRQALGTAVPSTLRVGVTVCERSRRRRDGLEFGQDHRNKI